MEARNAGEGPDRNPRWRFGLWSLGKLLLAAAILGAVGWQFCRDLTTRDEDGRLLLAELHWQPGWLALSVILYLGFQSCSCWYWRRLLAHFGVRLSLLTAARAYYVSQLGKYVPGKALALLMRGLMVRGPNLRLGLAMVTAFYEVLTTMAAGALVAAVAFIIQPSDVLDLRLHPVAAGLLLLGLCAFPLVPAVFNRIAARMAKKLQTDDAGPLPPIDMFTLLQGIGVIACGWCLLGVSVWAALAAVLPDGPPLDARVWLRCVGAVGLAYVAGFLTFFMPAGLGTREGILLRLLGYAGPAPLIAAAVLLMRVAWTIAELILAGMLYSLRSAGSQAVAQSEPSR